MDWVSFGKRLVASLVIFTIISIIASILIFQVLTPWSFLITLLFMGVFLLIFGACLQTPFIEALATARYAINPQVTRDTARHYSTRRTEQSSSGVVILVTGILLLLIGSIGFAVLPLFP